MNTGDDRATNLIGCVPSHRRRSRIPGLSSSSGSTSPALQCTDLARELQEIDMVAKDDVTIGITNQEVVAEDFPLSGTVRLGYAHVRAAFS